MARNLCLKVIVGFLFVTLASGQNASTSTKTFTLVNTCKETIWPGIITTSGNTTGESFTLKPGDKASYNATLGWSGRIWARTGCNFDKNGNGQCQTGGCGTSLNCTVPSSPPNTIAEFTLGETDFYDVSLVDGFNLPIAVTPLGSKGNCSVAGCDGDLRQNCPSQLAFKPDGKVVACRSACDAFNTDEYCCRGAYAVQGSCSPSNYSKSFKQICPAASSYAFDEQASIVTCSASDYVVAFCASRNQSVCSYHANKLVCNTNTSDGMKILPHNWWIMVVLALPLSAILHINIKP